MLKIKDILVETRDWAKEMQAEYADDPMGRIQFSCQIWNLERMIDIVDGIKNIRNRIRGKQR